MSGFSRSFDGVCVLLQGSRNSSRSSSPSVRMMPPDKTSSRGYFSPDDPSGTHDSSSRDSVTVNVYIHNTVLYQSYLEKPRDG